MDALAEFFELVNKKIVMTGQFLGLLHVLIGRKINKTDGTPVSAGMTFREVAGWLKKVRWAPESVRDLGLDPETLPLRDRQRFWLLAIIGAGVDSAAASQAGDRFATVLRGIGYEVSGAPRKK